MKILLLGGTGAMGKPLATYLSRNGHSVFVTSRSKRANNDNVRYLCGNAKDDSFLSDVLNSSDWDSIVDFMVYGTKEFEARAAKLTAATKQYIFISSCRVFADMDEFITEKSPRLLDVVEDPEYLETDEYALRKAREENIVRKFRNTTIIRPSVTFNDRRLQLGVYEVEDWLNNVLYGRPITFSHDIASHYTTMTYGNDVAVGIAGLIGNPNAIGEDFNVVTDQYMTWAELLQIYLNVLERRNLPYNVFITNNCLNLKVKKWQYQVKYARLFDRRYDNRKFLSAIPGFEFTDSRKALVNCMEHYLDSNNPKLLSMSYPALLQDHASGHIVARHHFTSAVRYLKYLVARFIPETLLLKLIER